MKSCAFAAFAAAMTSIPAGAGPAKRNVFADRDRKEERFLKHDADLASKRVDSEQIAHIVPINEHIALYLES